MKRSLLLVLLTFVLVARASALSEKGQEAAKQLETAMLDEVKAQKPKDGESRSGNENYRTAMIPRIKALLDRPENGQLAETLAQLSSLFTSEAVLKSATALQEIIRLEQDAAENSAIQEITQLLDRSGEVIRQAKTPADLDGIIADLGKNRQRGNNGQMSEKTRAAYNQIEPTLQFATYWQNYLAAKATGDTQTANNVLQNITNNSSSPYFIPRSQILALMKRERSDDSSPTELPQASIDKILDDVKTLADIEKAVSQLRALQNSQRNPNGNSPASLAIQTLQPIEKTYQEFKAGLGVNIELGSFYNGNSTDFGTALFARLKADLFLLVLPRYVGAPEGTSAKPGEGVSQFLERLIAEAKERGDINVGLRSREALRVLQRGSNFTNSDSSGMFSFVAGQNQETAGQFMLAVMSYQAALKSGSDLVPSRIIGERLTAIQTAHPKEFEMAMERFLNPPPVQRSDYPQGMRPPYFGNDPRSPQPTPPPALMIPPAPISSPTATPSPAPAASPTK